MAEITVGIRSKDQHTGQVKAKDVVQAIRTAVSSLVMKRELPGAFSVEFKEGALQGVIEFHAQPSESTGQLMYYGQGKDMSIGSLKGLNVGWSIMFPKANIANFIDDDSLALYKAAKLCAKGGKDANKLTADQRKLLTDQGVNVEAELKR